MARFKPLLPGEVDERAISEAPQNSFRSHRIFPPCWIFTGMACKPVTWFHRRLFTYLLLCGLVFGSVFFARLTRGSHKSTLDFLPNVARHRSARVCSTRALVLVISYPGHSHHRQVIRQTWANPRVILPLDISVAFGVGKSAQPDLQRTLDWEAEVFGDIFQGPEIDFEGSRSSSKVVQLLKTARSACDPIPTFYLKIEEDVFVNPFLLDHILQDLETFSSSNTLWCLDWQRTFDRPRSNVTWWVPKSNLNKVVHPRHCVSAVYMMTARALDSIIRLHKDQASNTLLPEDVYVTGVMTRKAGTRLFLLGERFPLHSWNERVSDKEEISFAYLAENVEDAAKIWQTVLSGKENLELQRTYDIGL